MKATFPYMGNIYIPVRTLFSELGAQPIIPLPPNKRTLEIGTQHAPETMCIPFKLTLGNMINALEMGADTLVYLTGFWSCRFGYYGLLQNYILRDLKYKFHLNIISGQALGKLFGDIKRINHNSDTLIIRSILKAFYKAGYKSQIMEYMEKTAREIRPYEIEKGKSTEILNRYLKFLDQTQSVKAMKHLKDAYTNEVKTIEKDITRKPIKIMIVGESFCMVEPFVNFNLIQKLGEMSIFANPFLTASRWLDFHLTRKNLKKQKYIQELIRPYLKYNVGGEDENIIGYSLLAAKDGYDGVICLHPFNCMPSVVVQPIVQKLCRERNLPYLEIGLDEHTSETGFYTRIDAFISVLEKRRKMTY